MINQNFDAESYATNFLSADKLELIRFSESNGFSFSEEELLFIQSHFRDQKKALPTYKQLAFFNEISKIRQKEKTNLNIGSVSTKTPERSIIFETAKDLLAKKNVCQKRLFGATPLSFTALTASEYLKYIDCAEKDSFFTPANLEAPSNYYIHSSNGVPLFSLSDNEVSQDNNSNKKEKDSTKQKNVIAMLLPLNEMSTAEYNQKAQEFFALSNSKIYIENVKSIKNKFGLLEILIKETDGILVSLANISETEKDEEGNVYTITPLINGYLGRYIFDLDPANTARINTIASEYGLCINNFAIRNTSKLFALAKNKNPAFCFKFDFLLEFLNFKLAKKYVFINETDEHIGNKKSVFLTSRKADGLHTYSADKILAFTKTIASASSRDLKNSPYKTAAFTTLDAINALVSKGIPKNSIKLSIHYLLLGQTDDSIELGKNFAAILGAYRTMIELCVSDENPIITYNSNKRNITVVAAAKASVKKVNTHFSNKESFVYFIPIQYDTDGCPNYEKYRYALKYFYILFENDAIISSFSVNENITSIISNASQNNIFSYSTSINDSEPSYLRGILFETYKELPTDESLIFIGKNLPY